LLLSTLETRRAPRLPAKRRLRASERSSRCFSVETVGRDTVITFDDCSGSWGLFAVDGVLTVTWTPRRGYVEYLVVTDGFSVGGASMSFQVTALAYPEGADRTRFDVTSESESVGRRGNTSTSSAAYEVLRDGECLDVDGTWSGDRRDGWTLTVEGFHNCSGTCPESGRVTRGDLTLEFDGDSTASWTRGERSGELPLFCE